MLTKRVVKDFVFLTMKMAITFLRRKRLGDSSYLWQWLPHFEILQEDCLEKGVPLLLDCAWFGTCRDITIDVYLSVITEVCFRLTKGTRLGNII